MKTEDEFRAHGLEGSLVEPDWPALTLAEVDRLLKRYPEAGGAVRLLSRSPRPFSSAGVVQTPLGKVFVKRHSESVRDREGLLEEHRFIEYLAQANWGGPQPFVAAVLTDELGDSAIADGKWTYEVHPVAEGVDVYEHALSWTPLINCGYARAAGKALAMLHRAASKYLAPARKPQQLVSSFSIFGPGMSEEAPLARMEGYLARRPNLQRYADARDWRRTMNDLMLPTYRELIPWLGVLDSVWTHNDFHGSNLMWTDRGSHAKVTSIIDFGLADRTNAVHDIALAIERNVIEWLRMDETGAEIIHLEHLDALLEGYHEVRDLTYQELRALVAMLPIVHCEFALSETDYFLSILHAKDKAYLAYEGYFVAHANWFRGGQGKRLLDHLALWAERAAHKHEEKEA